MKDEGCFSYVYLYSACTNLSIYPWMLSLHVTLSWRMNYICIPAVTNSVASWVYDVAIYRSAMKTMNKPALWRCLITPSKNITGANELANMTCFVFECLERARTVIYYGNIYRLAVLNCNEWWVLSMTNLIGGRGGFIWIGVRFSVNPLCWN